MLDASNGQKPLIKIKSEFPSYFKLVLIVPWLLFWVPVNANGQLDILMLISICWSTDFMQIVKFAWED